VGVVETGLQNYDDANDRDLSAALGFSHFQLPDISGIFAHMSSLPTTASIPPRLAGKRAIHGPCDPRIEVRRLEIGQLSVARLG
jgi:hypothetical protein